MKKKIFLLSGLCVVSLAADPSLTTFLSQCGIPLASSFKKDPTGKADPILYKVVARREANEQYVKRNPHIKKGHFFPRLVVEFFLKTENKQWNGYSLPYDNPFIQFRDNKGYLYHPEKPLWDQEPFLGLDDYPLKKNDQSFLKVIEVTAKTFLIVEKVWQLADKKLIDLTLEFGFNAEGNLILYDEIIPAPEYDEPIPQSLPKQQIILFRGSEKDDIKPFINYLKPFIGEEISVNLITCSMHSDPIIAYQNILKAVHAIPDSVLIAFVEKSNAAGPILAATTLVPTITVPLDNDKFSKDIWSALHLPANVPALTIVDQSNAALATLQILAIRNPRLYAFLQMQKMSKLQNVISM